MHATSCSTRPKSHRRIERSQRVPQTKLSAQTLDELGKEAKRLRAVLARCRKLIENLNSVEV
jgi:hypothetical protein